MEAPTAGDEGVPREGEGGGKMLKEVGIATLGVALAGVFVGAVTIEVVHRKYPDLVKQTEGQAKKAVSGFSQTIESFRKAFKEGYAHAT